jgi:hypothetical protein
MSMENEVTEGIRGVEKFQSLQETSELFTGIIIKALSHEEMWSVLGCFKLLRFFA